MTSMPRNFYRVAAMASMLSALTTLGLIFLPLLFAAHADGIEGRMMRVMDPAYQLRSWIYLVHPFLCFTAVLALGIACRRAAPALALAGVLGFGLWAITEAGQQALTLFAFDDWRRAWLAGDQAVRATMEMRAAIYDGLWDSSYSLLLIGIILGSGFFCALLVRFKDGLSRTVGLMFGANVFLSLTFLSGEMGGPTLPPDFSFWIYPALQPLARILLGVWLLRVARRGEPT